MTSRVVKAQDTFTIYHYLSVSQWLQICHHLSPSYGCTDRPRNLGVHFVTTRHVIILNAPKTDSSKIDPFRDCLALKKGLKSCPETSVTNYKSILRNFLEERRSLDPFMIYTNYLINKMNKHDNIISYPF